MKKILITFFQLGVTGALLRTENLYWSLFLF